ncbi:MAG: AAA family ATPase [Candidatus Kapabacteria bacterium]|nr:AAA family ATPase [Candidatus Kapabacteria bacterium]
MDENLKYYLENTMVSKTVIESRLTHPITKLRYPTRLVFDVLRKYAKDFLESGIEPRFISLAGLRGVGKTTLLWQTANYIISNYKINTYFFNVNTLRNLDIDLHIALEEFQRIILKKRFNELTETIILLFDEVHDDENWSRTLKILYDEARTAFILCTGSSALLLNQTADLTRRMRIEKIYPFKFIEFIAAKSYLEKNGKMIVPIKGLSKNLKEILFYSDSSNYAYSQLKDLEINIQEYFDVIKNLNSNSFKDLLQGYIN